MKASFDARAASSSSVEEARAYAARALSLVEAKLDELVPGESAGAGAVHAAIRWSLFAPAKRFRPLLLLATGETFGAKTEQLLATACAFEMIHTYSLVHDDLPAMDDDELRRGRPTCHVKFGETTAILAGDALQALAFQTIAEDETLDAPLRVHLIAELARAAGTPEGMVAGQAHDLAAESREDVGGEELELIHRRKTGALIQAAARAGAIIAGDSRQRRAGAQSHLPVALRPRRGARARTFSPRRSQRRARRDQTPHRHPACHRPPHPRTPRLRSKGEHL
ncbi:MAG: polyprenyl synthetase family protein [Acidobacteria bacterium]|nr:polyprenyl synthetase family protein [Acidobacteriota bacterium]